MTEHEAMTLLAEANPVRVDDLPKASPAELLSAILTRARRPRRRRLVVALAVAGAALAASLIGVFVFRGSSPRPVVGGQSLIGVGSLPTVEHPLGDGAKQVSLADATTELGRPIVLPDTSLVSASEAGPVWMSSSAGETVVAVTFPSAGVFIDYQTGENVYYDDVLLLYQAIANEDARTFHVVDLNGVPALAGDQNSVQTGTNIGSVMFDAGGVRVTVFGHHDRATLQALAQSTVDRSEAPPPGQLGQVGGVQLFSYFPAGETDRARRRVGLARRTGRAAGYAAREGL